MPVRLVGVPLRGAGGAGGHTHLHPSYHGRAAGVHALLYNADQCKHASVLVHALWNMLSAHSHVSNKTRGPPQPTAQGKSLLRRCTSNAITPQPRCTHACTQTP